MPEALIVTALRTPIGRAVKGSLREVRPDDLVSVVIAEAVSRVLRALEEEGVVTSLLDPDEQRVDGSFCDVGEALIPQPRRDLVAVRGPTGQDREDDALQRPFEHLRFLLAHGTPPLSSSLCY